jgi:hypothetical protein
MPKVVPKQNFESYPGSAGRNAITFWDGDPDFSEELSETMWCAGLQIFS